LGYIKASYPKAAAPLLSEKRVCLSRPPLSYFSTKENGGLDIFQSRRMTVFSFSWVQNIGYLWTAFFYLPPQADFLVAYKKYGS
jgi:hypothetical protein